MPGFDPSASMLSGGNSVPIVAVQGGGAPTAEQAARKAKLEEEINKLDRDIQEKQEQERLLRPENATLKSELQAEKGELEAQERIKVAELEALVKEIADADAAAAAPAAPNAATLLRGAEEERKKRRAAPAAAATGPAILSPDAPVPALLVTGAAAVVVPPAGDPSPPGPGPALPVRGSKGYVEYYKPIPSKSDVTAYIDSIVATPVTEIQKELASLRPAYKAAQLKKWNRIKQDGSEEPSPPMKRDRCPEIGTVSATKGMTGTNRLVTVLPTATLNIVMIPPLNGNIDSLKAHLSQLVDLKILTYDGSATSRLNIAEGNVLIFMPSIYQRISSGKRDQFAAIQDKNVRLFYILMQLKQGANNDKVYALADYTTDSALVSCAPGIQDDDGTLTHLLEPSYIYVETGIKGLLFSASAADEATLPKSSIDNYIGLSKFIKNAEKVKSGGSFAFPPTPPNMQGDPIAKQFIRHLSITEKKEFYKLPNSLSSIKIQKIKCPTLERVTTLDLIPKENPSMRFFVTTVNFDKEKDVSMMTIYRIYQPDAKYEPLCVAAAAAPALKKKAKKVEGGFEDQEDLSKLALDLVDYEEVPLNGELFLIRIPSDEVRANWRDLKFTADEAEFLNALNLRPDIIQDILGDLLKASVGEAVAALLEGVARSKCYTDLRFLPHKDCDYVRRFVDAVYLWYYQRDVEDVFALRREDEAQAAAIKAKRDMEKAAAAAAASEAAKAAAAEAAARAAAAASAEAAAASMDSLKLAAPSESTVTVKKDVLPVPIEIAGKPGSWSLNVLALNKKADPSKGVTYKMGSLEVEAPNSDTARDAFIKMIKEIHEGYPQWQILY